MTGLMRYYEQVVDNGGDLDEAIRTMNRAIWHMLPACAQQRIEGERAALRRRSAYRRLYAAAGEDVRRLPEWEMYN